MEIGDKILKVLLGEYTLRKGSKCCLTYKIGLTANQIAKIINGAWQNDEPVTLDMVETELYELGSLVCLRFPIEKNKWTITYSGIKVA